MDEKKCLQDRPFAAMLPNIYRDDPVLDDLLGVLEPCHRNLEQMIEGLPESLYRAEETPEAFLDYLGAELGLRNCNGQFTPAQMRALLPFSFWLHQRKGTRAALELLLWIYFSNLCGHPVRFWIAEPGEAGTPASPPDQSAEIVVHVAGEPQLKKESERLRLEMLVRDYTPAAVDVRVEYGARGPLGGAYLGYTTIL